MTRSLRKCVARNVETVMHAERTSYAPYCCGLTGYGWAIVTILTAAALVWLWFLVARGRNSGVLRELGYWLHWGALVFLASFIAYIVWGAYPDPQFRLSKLKGLTPEQVIARLGPPTVKSHTAPPDTANESRLMFDYTDKYRLRGFEYSVIFGRNNRVEWVLVGSH